MTDQRAGLIVPDLDGYTVREAYERGWNEAEMLHQSSDGYADGQEHGHAAAVNEIKKLRESKEALVRENKRLASRVAELSPGWKP